MIPHINTWHTDIGTFWSGFQRYLRYKACPIEVLEWCEVLGGLQKFGLGEGRFWAQFIPTTQNIAIT